MNGARTLVRAIRDKSEPELREARLWTNLRLPLEAVLVGPWLGEVGPELLYWIPYLAALKRRGFFGGLPIIALSRGGVGVWYAHVADRYVELFDYMSVQDFQDARLERQATRHASIKQRIWSERERALVEHIAGELGIGRFTVVHPLNVWVRMRRWLRETEDLRTAVSRLEFSPFTKTDPQIAGLVDGLKLPANFTAVKFYGNDLFSVSARSRAAVHALLVSLSRTRTLVSLQSPLMVDDHEPLAPPSSMGIVDVSNRIDLRTNLGVQTEILKRAEALVGTYGGFSVLPAFLGKPAIGLYDRVVPQSLPIHFQHEALTTYVYELLADGAYSVLRLDSAETLLSVLAT